MEQYKGANDNNYNVDYELKKELFGIIKYLPEIVRDNILEVLGKNSIESLLDLSVDDLAKISRGGFNEIHKRSPQVIENASRGLDGYLESMNKIRDSAISIIEAGNSVLEKYNFKNI